MLHVGYCTYPFIWGLGDSAGFNAGFCGTDGRASPVKQNVPAKEVFMCASLQNTYFLQNLSVNMAHRFPPSTALKKLISKNDLALICDSKNTRLYDLKL